MMNLHPIAREGYQLLHDGSLELARVEENGIRVDTGLLERSERDLSERIRKTRDELMRTGEWGSWRKRFGERANLTSPPQLASVLVKDLGVDISKRTEAGRVATDAETLSEIDIPFVRMWGELVKLTKTLNTFVRGIGKEVDEYGRLHPFFNLHLARTYRSSSDSPNFQNLPVRDKEFAKLVRELLIASEGCVLVENDFKGIEVSVSACYHKDQNFIDYITTPGKDMHRDMAGQIYMLEPGDVYKEIRYGGKNKFVFPQFYGDFYVSCARSLWDWIGRAKLKGPDGKSLYKHLRRQGIRELGDCDPDEPPRDGTFEKHLQEVEDDFWNNRFQAYGQWRRDWYREYRKNGYFDILTGFRVSGVWPRNAVINYPVQGAAFHCLLWTLIQVNRALRKYKMRSKVVGQIHDSLIGDVREEELRDYLCIVEEIVSVRLPKHFKWIIVPMVIEYEMSPRGQSWFGKREFKFADGRFGHPQKEGRWTKDPSRFLEALDGE